MNKKQFFNNKKNKKDKGYFRYNDFFGKLK